MPGVGDGPDGGALPVSAAGRCGDAYPAAGLGGRATAVWISPSGAAVVAGGSGDEPQEAAAALCGGALAGAASWRAQTCPGHAGADRGAGWPESTLVTGFRIGQSGGRAAFRVLCVVDDCTRECLGLVADTSLSGLRVARELDTIVAVRGLALHRAGQAAAERVLRELQRAAAGRMPERDGVHVAAAGAGGAGGVARDYNHVRPHSALGGRAPGWLSVPPCSPASRPLRVAYGDGLPPALTQAARDGSGKDGRDGETALDRTEKHRHDGRGGNRGLYFWVEERRGLRQWERTAHYRKCCFAIPVRPVVRQRWPHCARPRRRASLIDEDQMFGIRGRLGLEPHSAPCSHVGAFVVASECVLFSKLIA